ncbi:hypothetical protein Bbelb_241830 [Branchiostoma belcheri]|nr:hypothetical protein Bbelb_241830 [Branchiostoma belcheri]
MSSRAYKDMYDDHFKTAREYLDYFYSNMLGADVDEGLAMPWIFHQLHQTFTGDRDFGRRLLDVGSGPTVYQLISASRVCPEIICSDINKGALAEIKKWKNGDPNAFDWTDADSVRRRYSPCTDALRLPTFLHVDSAQKHARRSLSDEYHLQGKKVLDDLCLDPEFVLKSLSEAGITVLETSVYKTPEREECAFSDVKSIMYVVGQKTHA